MADLPPQPLRDPVLVADDVDEKEEFEILAVLAVQPDVGFRRVAQLFGRGPSRAGGFPEIGEEDVQVLEQDPGVDLFLASEMVVDRPLAEFDRGGDVVEGHGAEAVLDEEVLGCRENEAAPGLELPEFPLLDAQDDSRLFVDCWS